MEPIQTRLLTHPHSFSSFEIKFLKAVHDVPPDAPPADYVATQVWGDEPDKLPRRRCIVGRWVNKMRRAGLISPATFKLTVTGMDVLRINDRL